MKILVLTHRSNFSGGANRSLLAVILGLKKKGHTLEVVLPKKKGELNDALTNEGVSWKYCRYYRMGAKKYKGIGIVASYAILYGKYLHHYIVSKELEHVIDFGNYDVVYTNTILPYAGLFAAKRYGIPSVIHDREPLDTTVVPQIKGYESFLYNHANKIIVISRNLKKQWADRGFEKNIVLINNGIPKQVIDRTSQIKRNEFSLLMTARIAQMKHHLDALSALLILKEKGYKDIKLYFAGSEGEKSDTIYHKELDDFIAKNNMQNEVIFLGEVKDMISLRSKMNVELMCNPTEPFGRVTVEGMRSGLIVIGVNAGGTQDIIIDGINGLLYEEENIKELADKIELVYIDDDFRKKLSKSAYEYGNTHFTMEENVDRIEGVLLSVTEKRLDK